MNWPRACRLALAASRSTQAIKTRPALMPSPMETMVIPPRRVLTAEAFLRLYRGMQRK
jgi:hypothetical protein